MNLMKDRLSERNAGISQVGFNWFFFFFWPQQAANFLVNTHPARTQLATDINDWNSMSEQHLSSYKIYWQQLVLISCWFLICYVKSPNSTVLFFLIFKIPTFKLWAKPFYFYITMLGFPIIYCMNACYKMTAPVSWVQSWTSLLSGARNWLNIY